MTKPFSELRMGMPAQAQQSAHVRAQQMLRHDSDALEPPPMSERIEVGEVVLSSKQMCNAQSGHREKS